MSLSIEEDEVIEELAQRIIRGRRRREAERKKKDEEDEEYLKELEKESVYVCSFCRKNSDEVKKIIAGPDVFICDECVELSNVILEGELIRPKPDEKVCEECGKNDTSIRTLCGRCRM